MFNISLRKKNQNILETLNLYQALELAKIKLSEGSKENAKVIYKDILEIFPNNTCALKGIESLNKIFFNEVNISLNPPQENLQIIINLYEQGKLTQCLSQANDILKFFPHSDMIYNILGATYTSLKKYNLAIENYKNAINLNSDNALAYNNLGNALKANGQLEEAVESFKNAIKIKPDHALAYYNMGNAMQKNGKLSYAIKNYKKALTLNPFFAEAYLNIGIALKEKGNFEESIENYKQALKIKPNYAEAYYNMGLAQGNKGDIRACMESCKQALKIIPEFIEAFEKLESIQVQIDDKDIQEILKKLSQEAKFRNLISKNPKHQIVQAIFYFMLGDRIVCLEKMRNYFTLEKTGRTKFLNLRDQQFCSAYQIFLSKLIKKWPKRKHSSSHQIFHFGESHCLSFCHGMIKLSNQELPIFSKITFGAKAYHFSKDGDNEFKSITRFNLNKIPSKSLIMISIGEIDCRIDEGLIQASQKNGKNINNLVKKTVLGYVNWFLNCNKIKKHKYYFFNIPSPVYNLKIPEIENQKVADVVNIFNEELKRILIKKSLFMIDVYEATKNKDGFSNHLYHSDQNHLDNRILPIIQKQMEQLNHK